MLHALVVLGACIPALLLLARFAIEGPGANPVEDITHASGEWSIRLVLASLAISPLRRVSGSRRIVPMRRTLGLAGFAYALVHVSIWAYFELGLDLLAIVDEIFERPFITAGMGAFVILAALAGTSTARAMRWLGPRWNRLHQAVYFAAVLAVLHQIWGTKADYSPAILHAAILLVLLIARFWIARRRGAQESLPRGMLERMISPRSTDEDSAAKRAEPR